MLAACLMQDTGEVEQQQILGEVWQELDRLEARQQVSEPPVLTKDEKAGTALRHVLGRVRFSSLASHSATHLTRRLL